jgi:hypothetical protein
MFPSLTELGLPCLQVELQQAEAASRPHSHQDRPDRTVEVEAEAAMDPRLLPNFG